MDKRKAIASISLDLDNQWSYMKIHGDKGWEEYPSYLDVFLPLILDVLDELGLRITFFVVGKDTERQENWKYLRMISERGHEIGNHSYHHESWLQTYSYDKIENEIRQAEEAIEKVTGKRTVSFRGPGFSWSKDLLKVLETRGYKFDASTLPTFLGPLARAYYFNKSDLTREEKKARKELFGKFSEGFRKVKPYNWDLGQGKVLMEIPVTTIPFFKLPFHQSYLLYISGISKGLMKLYLWIAIMMCKLTKTPPSYLLHPLDLIGGNDIPQLAFFPGMNIESDKKLEIFKIAMRMLKKHFDLLPMNEFAAHFNKGLKNVAPK